MFLALQELMKEKKRFALITFVVVLVGYLTFFLTALAYGLATSYTQGVDAWGANGIVLQKDANNTIGRSLLTIDDYGPLQSDDTAILGAGTATIEKDGVEDVAIFGIELDDFLVPRIIEGRTIGSANEIVVSDELKQIGVEIGQELAFKGGNQAYDVVGFTDRATFQTAPIVYMELPQWRLETADLAGMTGMKDDTTVSALVTRNDAVASDFATDTTEWQSIRDFSFELPGYQAQVLTFSLMIGFLIGIAAFVLAVFMYILTIQKQSIFGVLKAEGVSNAYISRSVMTQITLISASGLIIGLVLAMISGAFLAGKVPFLVNPLFFIGIFALFILFAAIGGLASVRAVTKIDPVEAIG